MQVSVNLSSFMIDLNQIAVAVNYCTSRSLLLIDEFGKVNFKINTCIRDYFLYGEFYAIFTTYRI